MLRRGPFHGYDSLVSFERSKDSTRDEMPKREFFLARPGCGFTKSESPNGTEEEAKTAPQNEEIEGNWRRGGSRKKISHIFRKNNVLSARIRLTRIVVRLRCGQKWSVVGISRRK